MRETLVGIESAQQSGHALRWAIELAESMSEPGRVRAVHVLPDARAAALGLPPHVPPAVDEERRASAEQNLGELVRGTASRSSVEVDGQVFEGDPAETLLDLAEDADLLVLGATTKGRIAGVILGSTSRKCVAAGAVPVAIIPRLDHATPDGGPAQ